MQKSTVANPPFVLLLNDSDVVEAPQAGGEAAAQRTVRAALRTNPGTGCSAIRTIRYKLAGTTDAFDVINIDFILSQPYRAENGVGLSTRLLRSWATVIGVDGNEQLKPINVMT